MDFHSLARKELQALCKKNKIPANLTNVAMANALKALPKVEGLDELGNAQQSPERIIKAEPGTAFRTSTRKKLVKVEPESSRILTHTRRTTRRTVADEDDNENKSVKLLKTPASTNRRSGPAASTRRKIDTQLIGCGENEKQEVQAKSDVKKTPGIRSLWREAPADSTRRKVEALKDAKSVQKVYGTRHSVRLLQKTMEDLSLKKERKIEAVKFEELSEETEEVERPKDLPGERKIEAVKFEELSEETEEVEQPKDLPDVLLENESETYEALEDNKPNDHEVDQLPENEFHMKHRVTEDNKSDECEVDSDERHNIDQFLGTESESHAELPENSNKANDTETVDCDIKLETETSANSDNLLELDAEEDDNDSSETFIQVENSDKAIYMVYESIDDKGSDVQITENPEKTMNSALVKEMENEFKANQYDSDNYYPSVMETEHQSIADVPDEITNMLVSSSTSEELTEDVSKSSDVNKMQMEKVDDETGDQIFDLVDDDFRELYSDSDKTLTESSEISKEHMEKAEWNEADEFNTCEIYADEDEQTEDVSKSSEEKKQQMEKVNYEMEAHIFDLVDNNCHELDSDSDETLWESSEISKEHMEKTECNNADEFNTGEINTIDAQTSDVVRNDFYEFDSFSDRTASSVQQKSPYLVSDMTSDDGRIVSEEELDSTQAFNKSILTSLKEFSPRVPAAKVVSLQFSGNTIQGQFPRPEKGKSAEKKQTTVEKMILEDDMIINKENIDRGREVDDEALWNMSLRELTRTLKEKLQIKNNAVSKAETKRALQKLPENAAEQVHNLN